MEGHAMSVRFYSRVPSPLCPKTFPNTEQAGSTAGIQSSVIALVPNVEATSPIPNPQAGCWMTPLPQYVERIYAITNRRH